MLNTTIREGLRNLPLINPALISVSKGKLYLSSYTETSAVLYSADVSVETPPLTLMLSPEAVKTFIKLLSGKEAEVSISMDDLNFRVSVGKKKTVFTTTPDKKTLQAAKMLRDNVIVPTFTCDVKDFESALSGASHFAGDKTLADVRFHGYHLLLDESGGEVMSSNNKGMSIKTFKVDSLSENISLVLPKDVLFLIKNLVGTAQVEIRDKTKLFVEVDNGTSRYSVLCSLVNNTPLNYRPILPKKPEKTNIIRIAKADISDALGEGAYFSPDDTYRRIRFKVDGDLLILNAINSSRGTLEVTIPVEADADDEFELSYTTLAQLVSNTSNDILTIEVYSKRVVIENGSRNILAKFDV
jgi:hypothetical protein